MALSVFHDPNPPTSSQIMEVLGPAWDSWSSLFDWLTETAGVDSHEWKNSGAAYGWSMRVKRGKRIIAYMIPQDQQFLVGLVLGDRAMKTLGSLSLAPSVMDVIRGAKRYGEGTGFRLPVSSESDLESIQSLIELKLR
ncbi:MAG TPA: DUF3788 family protein [Thermoanaerobaculia bacterium]|nr:DUF3788 family protein [Thermoanaerobaculia bacterium]HUM29221.1 DUF3788 family protein [Thermoanaerobaculia bacterium]HXK67820.1 DUF3788 family protein [Thermoanaerobaculia bacterium]